MDTHTEAKNRALSCIKIADHMLTMTYPMVQDSKILIAVLENIFLSLTGAMAAVLYYESKYKRVEEFNDNFDSKLMLFKKHVLPKYNLSRGYIPFIIEIKEIIREHKESPVEFRRKGNFVITTSDYTTRTLSDKQVKEYLAKAKLFIDEVLSVIKKNE